MDGVLDTFFGCIATAPLQRQTGSGARCLGCCWRRREETLKDVNIFQMLPSGVSKATRGARLFRMSNFCFVKARGWQTVTFPGRCIVSFLCIFRRAGVMQAVLQFDMGVVGWSLQVGFCCCLAVQHSGKSSAALVSGTMLTNIFMILDNSGALFTGKTSKVGVATRSAGSAVSYDRSCHPHL